MFFDTEDARCARVGFLAVRFENAMSQSGRSLTMPYRVARLPTVIYNRLCKGHGDTGCVAHYSKDYRLGVVHIMRSNSYRKKAPLTSRK